MRVGAAIGARHGTCAGQRVKTSLLARLAAAMQRAFSRCRHD